jgi:hypothetical protein
VERLNVSRDFLDTRANVFSQFRRTRSFALRRRRLKERIDEVYVRRPAREMLVVCAPHGFYRRLNRGWRQQDERALVRQMRRGGQTRLEPGGRHLASGCFRLVSRGSRDGCCGWWAGGAFRLGPCAVKANGSDVQQGSFIHTLQRPLLIASPCGNPRHSPPRLAIPSHDNPSDTRLTRPLRPSRQRSAAPPSSCPSARRSRLPTMDGTQQPKKKWGITHPLSEAKPEPKDLKANEQLIEYLKSINNFESPEGNDRRYVPQCRVLRNC